ncbi:MAG: HIT domain-containing protein [Eubacterium sp.]|nr:HIT domain-containing protein [Eubacterium sp.]
MEDCIFCKLANGVFETNTLFEDENFRVIFDASPATVGHVLIIPKEHYANVFEIPEDLAGKAYILAKKVAAVLKEVTGCNGVNILQNNGEAAGQTVFHFHMHVVPRYDEKIITWVQKEAEQNKIDEIIEKAKDLF